jgi:RNA 2',3'-cyclic 3'-phosphodiesterase
MRTFLSINLSDAIITQIQSLQRALHESASGIRWTKPENCHLTLQFLGEYPDDQIRELGRVLDPVAQRFSPFPLELGALGTFPPHGPLSILWIGVTKGESTLLALADELQQALSHANISFDKKSFVPHLTIGRAQRNQKVFLSKKEIPALPRFSVMTVDAFFGMQSQLTPEGPIYTPRLRFPLGT